AAQDQSGLERSWRRFGFSGSAPPVDFNTHVVIAFDHRVGECSEGEIGALILSADGSLEPRFRERWPDPIDAMYACAEGSTRLRIEIIAVARSALPTQGFVFWVARA